MKFIYLFDLDSTITKKEILPTIARKIGIYDKMRELTESTMRGEIPFKQSFLERVDLLRNIPVDEVAKTVAEIPCSIEILGFIKKNKKDCYIVTGNLDVWIKELVKKIGMEEQVICSKAYVDEKGYITRVSDVVDKGEVIKNISKPFVAIGDGDNDAGMIEASDVGIGYGGVRDVSESVLGCASHVIYSEKSLLRLLEKTLEDC